MVPGMSHGPLDIRKQHGARSDTDHADAAQPAPQREAHDRSLSSLALETVNGNPQLSHALSDAALSRIDDQPVSFPRLVLPLRDIGPGGQWQIGKVASAGGRPTLV